MGVMAWQDKTNMKQRLLQNVQEARLSWLDQSTKSMSFEGICTELCDQALKASHTAKANAACRAQLAQLHSDESGR